MQSEFVTEILGARLPTRTVPDEDQQRFSTLREWVDEIREADLGTGEKTAWNEVLPRRVFQKLALHSRRTRAEAAHREKAIIGWCYFQLVTSLIQMGCATKVEYLSERSMRRAHEYQVEKSKRLGLEVIAVGCRCGCVTLSSLRRCGLQFIGSD